MSEKSPVDLIVKTMAEVWASDKGGSACGFARDVKDLPWLREDAEQLWAELSQRREVSDSECIYCGACIYGAVLPDGLSDFQHWTTCRKHPAYIILAAKDAEIEHLTGAINKNAEISQRQEVSDEQLLKHWNVIISGPSPTYSGETVVKLARWAIEQSYPAVAESETVKQLREDLANAYNARDVNGELALRRWEELSHEKRVLENVRRLCDDWQRVAKEREAEIEALKKQVAANSTPAWTREAIWAVATRVYDNHGFTPSPDSIAGIAIEAIADAVLERQGKGAQPTPAQIIAAVEADLIQTGYHAAPHASILNLLNCAKRLIKKNAELKNEKTKHN